MFFNATFSIILTTPIMISMLQWTLLKTLITSNAINHADIIYQAFSSSLPPAFQTMKIASDFPKL